MGSRGHLLENAYDIQAILGLLGHKDVNTTMIYTHVLKNGGKGVQSPIDGLWGRIYWSVYTGGGKNAYGFNMLISMANRDLSVF